MLSWVMCLRGLGASSRSSSAIALDRALDGRLGDGGDVEQGGGGQQGGVGVGHAVGVLSRGGCCGSRARAGAQRRDRVGGDVVECLGGVGDDVDAVALDAERRDSDREVDRGDVVLGEPADPLDSGLGVGPASVTETRTRSRGRRGFVISSCSQSSSIASPANAVPPPVLIPGTSGSGRVPSASSATLLPNRAVAQRPPICLSPSVRIQQIGPSAYSYAPIEPEVSITSPTCGSRIGAVIWRVIRHGWVLAGRPDCRCALPRA